MKFKDTLTRQNEGYVFTGKRGSLALCTIASKFHGLEKGDRLMVLSDEIWQNGETHINTSKGLLPSVFFYDYQDLTKYEQNLNKSI